MQKPFTVAIFDEQQHELEKADRLIWQYCTSNNVKAQLSCFHNQTEFLESIETLYFSVVFVAIRTTNDLEIAFRIRDNDKNCALVLVSNSGDYALAAYRLQATQYLLEPLDSEKIANILKKGNWF